VAGRVDQVEDIILTILRTIIQAHRLRLDGDAALLLDIHVIENLLLAGHLTRVHAARQLDEAVGERGLAMVDMGDDGEVANVIEGCGHSRGLYQADHPSASRSARLLPASCRDQAISAFISVRR
jgi:hypothetical protein